MDSPPWELVASGVRVSTGAGAAGFIRDGVARIARCRRVSGNGTAPGAPRFDVGDTTMLKDLGSAFSYGFATFVLVKLFAVRLLDMNPALAVGAGLGVLVVLALNNRRRRLAGAHHDGDGVGHLEG
jgi:hypothetical protein